LISGTFLKVDGKKAEHAVGHDELLGVLSPDAQRTAAVGEGFSVQSWQIIFV
jgi:hypothetical protein